MELPFAEAWKIKMVEPIKNLYAKERLCLHRLVDR